MSSPMHVIVWIDDAGWYYQRDLAAGKKLVERDGCAITISGPNEHNMFTAEISEPDQPNEPNEYGHAPTEDEAVRYAIGAFFGGCDVGEGVDIQWESRTIALLQVLA